jgi:hypothetical protein
MITGLNISVNIGAVSVNRVPEIRIVSERHSPITRMHISMPDPSGDVARAVSDKDEVSVVLGYRGNTPATWIGTVAGEPTTWKNRDQVTINVAGPERVLSDTMIKQAFFQETPEAIIKYAVSRAGLALGQIQSPGVTFPRFTASSIPAWQVVVQCEHTCSKGFGLDMAGWAMWMGRAGTVNWGAFEEVADLPVIESNTNLIAHFPGRTIRDLSRVETLLLPHLMHSMLFHLTDIRRGIDSDYKALRVEHAVRQGKARTFISYGTEYERY